MFSFTKYLGDAKFTLVSYLNLYKIYRRVDASRVIEQRFSYRHFHSIASSEPLGQRPLEK